MLKVQNLAFACYPRKQCYLLAKITKKCEFAHGYLFDRQIRLNFANYFSFVNQTFFSMKLIISGFLIFFLSASFVTAQQVSGICGNTAEEQIEHLLSKQRYYMEHVMIGERNEIQYVPIFFHLTADVNGAGRHKDRFVLDQLCDLNEAYAPMDIRFYLNPHPTYGLIDKSINSNTVYSTQTNEFLMNSRRHQNAINVFVVNEIPSSSSLGIVLGRYNPDRDWLTCRKDQINGNGNGTLAHENGHFFSLSHTFLGFESNPFDGENDPTWPIAPAISPNGNIFTERADGSNCTTAADEICDTPEDYNFGLGNGGCTYTGIAKDPLGASVDPMENNYMGYFSGCDFEFTPGQSTIVLSNLASSERNYLDNSFTPAATSLTVPGNLLTLPIQGDTLDFFDEVFVQWQSVPGATYYLLEFDISTFFATPNFYSVMVPATTTSMLITSLAANRNYYWRVRPFNEYSTCDPGKMSNFRTPTTSAVKSIDGLEAWNVFPNPAGSADEVNVAIKTSSSLDATVSIVSPAGQLVYEQRNIVLSGGETTIALPLTGLANGVYFVVLQNESGRAVRKLTVLK